MDPMERWLGAEGSAPEMVRVGGVELSRGSRVRLRPRLRADVFDAALAGRIAVVEGIEQDLEDNVHVAVTLLEDPGRDLGESRQPGHRFFFSIDEIEPLPSPVPARPAAQRVLVAGIGNVFLGDDGFGVEAVRLLGAEALPDAVTVMDFGIRGLDLAYALQDPYDAVILVDATPRGQRPGTVYVIEADVDDDPEVVLDTHGMDPRRVLALARHLGKVPGRVFVVGCEPQTVLTGEGYDDMLVGLSDTVAAALDAALDAIRELIDELRQEQPT
jgi:hydrogenase maturation protease